MQAHPNGFWSGLGLHSLWKQIRLWPWSRKALNPNLVWLTFQQMQCKLLCWVLLWLTMGCCWLFGLKGRRVVSHDRLLFFSPQNHMQTHHAGIETSTHSAGPAPRSSRGLWATRYPIHQPLIGHSLWFGMLTMCNSVKQRELFTNWLLGWLPVLIHHGYFVLHFVFKF